MNESELRVLQDAFNRGMISDEQYARLEQLIEEGVIQPDEISGIQSVHQLLDAIDTVEPSAQLDRKFYAMLSAEGPSSGQRLGYTWSSTVWLRWAAVGILFVAGVAIGRYSVSENHDDRVEALSTQITDLKEMVMLSLLEKDAATERLRAVSLTHDMRQVSDNVTGALLHTLNHDENINVRLAALEALAPYAREDSIRIELIRSIGKQQSPLVQVALAELMVALQEKSSVEELKKILQREDTPQDVKERIQQNIQTLI